MNDNKVLGSVKGWDDAIEDHLQLEQSYVGVVNKMFWRKEL